jgi:hypothetical protein
VKEGGVRQTSTDVVKAQSGREGFPIFLSLYLLFKLWFEFELEIKFESHTIKMQNKSHKTPRFSH